MASGLLGAGGAAGGATGGTGVILPADWTGLWGRLTQGPIDLARNDVGPVLTPVIFRYLPGAIRIPGRISALPVSTVHNRFL